MDYYELNTPLGIMAFQGDQAGIQSIRFLDEVSTKCDSIPDSLKEAVSQMDAFFEGTIRHFSFPMNPKGTPFQKKVWSIVSNIPYGTTLSYIKIAQIYGNTKAVRAVGAAIGKNPILVAIPCHRVIGSDSTLIGYAAGLARKRELLKQEGFPSQITLL